MGEGVGEVSAGQQGLISLFVELLRDCGAVAQNAPQDNDPIFKAKVEMPIEFGTHR
jgi:hypothetical protein